MKRLERIIFLLVILLLITNWGGVTNNNISQSFAVRSVGHIESSIIKAGSHNHTIIIGEYWIMNGTLTVAAMDIVEIINSTLDFSNVDTYSELIINYGVLIINNSHIISNLSQDHTYVVKSEGDLTIIESSFKNKELLVDFGDKTAIMVSAVWQHGQSIVFHDNYFENYTLAVDLNEAKSDVIYNNTFVNCPFGIKFSADDLVIRNNTFMNSIAAGISGSGTNITVENNYLSNDRELLQTDLDLFGDITKGIELYGSQSYVLNNTIINTFKSVVTFDSDHIIVEGNRIDTTGPTEGEIQAEGCDYLVYRNNYITNQWDSIEIYNSRHLLIERNYIENGVTAIRVERVDEYDGVDPINVTIQYNVITNSGFIGIEHGVNVKIQHNVLRSTDIKLDKNTVNALIHNNTIHEGNIFLTDSDDILVSNNHIESPNIGILQLNCQNVTLSNNVVLGFGGNIPIPNVLLILDLTISILAIIIPTIALLVIVIKRRRKVKIEK